MKRLDPIRLLPLLLVPVFACFLYDLAWVEAESEVYQVLVRAVPETAPVLAGEFLSYTREQYIRVVLILLLPFGLGVLSGRGRPGSAAVLLAKSALISVSRLNISDPGLRMIIFPAVLVSSVYGFLVCLHRWAQAADRTLALEDTSDGNLLELHT